MNTDSDILTRLERTIAARAKGDPAASYVARLHAGGVPLMARKLGEEAVETVVAALGDDRRELIGEAADTIFHLLVLLSAKGVAMRDVTAELAAREGLSGLDEKAMRNP
ncbi:MAG: phosphoribosyl-ATP diphosphatase [Pontixanthobacter sp.]